MVLSSEFRRAPLLIAVAVGRAITVAWLRSPAEHVTFVVAVAGCSLVQLHQPYSVLRLALYDRDTSTSALGGDELLGAADFQLHLLLPQRIYDIT